MATATKKQTAGNNALLAKVKRAMNKPTFARAAAIMNERGESACRAYMQGWFRSPLDEALDRMIATLDRKEG